VYGSIEYRSWRRRERLDEILHTGRVEEGFVRLVLKRRLTECRRGYQAGRRLAPGLGSPDRYSTTATGHRMPPMHTVRFRVRSKQVLEAELNQARGYRGLRDDSETGRT
jgi:hypothetical protein